MGPQGQAAMPDDRLRMAQRQGGGARGPPSALALPLQVDPHLRPVGGDEAVQGRDRHLRVL
eukprot:CAMPEP_0175374004 /NCGR_PEP_ID=MMETSP0095-20121207/23024_1 /TAXON_ID=311494 /ORGANISM="Alexandrium monilatum, Strain CCMP3105" /LENGTH=60 /DNA_ID=CAMNT_0016672219 /DNA_START=34 /DNA_END=214 /DNA_ORIENTATION=+